MPRASHALTAGCAVVAVAALAACGVGDGQGRTTAAASVAAPLTPSAPPASTRGATGAPAPSGSAAPSAAELTLAFAGDVHFAAQVADVLDDPATGLADLRPYLARQDLAMVNLETAVTTRGREMPKKFHFRAPATAFDALAAAGVDVVTLANNHAVDYGEVGLQDTLAARAQAPVPAVGLGRDAADAYAPAMLDVRGTKVAVLGATQVPDWTLATWPAGPSRPGVASAASPQRLAAAVRSARRTADVVVVYLHWGTDYTTCPNALQKRTAEALADAGADVVVGAHAHRVQGAGWLGRTYVAYGLGNFVWWRRNSAADAATGVLTLGVRGRRVVSARWVPLVVDADGVPRPPDAATSRRMLASWQDARGCTGLAARPAAG